MAHVSSDIWMSNLDVEETQFNRYISCLCFFIKKEGKIFKSKHRHTSQLRINCLLPGEYVFSFKLSSQQNMRYCKHLESPTSKLGKLPVKMSVETTNNLDKV